MFLLQYPLKELVVIHREQSALDGVQKMRAYILDELNVKQMTLTTDKTKWGVTLKAEPDFKTLGQRLKADLKKVSAQIKVTFQSKF